MLQLGPLDTEIYRLRLGALELGFSLKEIRPGRDPGGIAIIGHIQRLAIDGGRRIQKLFLGVHYPQLKIIAGQGRLSAESCCRQVCGACLGIGLAGFDSPAYPAPQVNFPG